MKIHLVSLCLVLSLNLFLFGCGAPKKSERIVTAEEIDFLGITNPDKLSAASKRALEWPKIGNEWFIDFKAHDLKGDFTYEKGVVRRDPSAMIKEEANTLFGTPVVRAPPRDLGEI